MKTGSLFLIPVPLGDTSPETVLPPTVRELAASLTHFVAENAKSARAFLKTLPASTPLQQIEIQELNEHTPAATVRSLLAPLLAGHDMGLISEAGCPAVADPGALLVAEAHAAGIRIMPCIGPSSLLLALMGSGLSGQSFAFLGYLPAKEDQRQKRIQFVEAESRREQRTQIFIETPYRNRQLFDALLRHCATTTRLCLATDLSLPTQNIRTQSISQWRQSGAPEFDRRPTVFLIQA